MKYEGRQLPEIVEDLDQRIAGVERRGSSPSGWLFMGVVLGAGIVGCCWLLSLRTVREQPRPAITVPAIECNCGTAPDPDGAELLEPLP